MFYLPILLLFAFTGTMIYNKFNTCFPFRFSYNLWPTWSMLYNLRLTYCNTHVKINMYSTVSTNTVFYACTQKSKLLNTKPISDTRYYLLTLMASCLNIRDQVMMYSLCCQLNMDKGGWQLRFHCNVHLLLNKASKLYLHKHCRRLKICKEVWCYNRTYFWGQCCPVTLLIEKLTGLISQLQQLQPNEETTKINGD